MEMEIKDGMQEYRFFLKYTNRNATQRICNGKTAERLVFGNARPFGRTYIHPTE
jgi:hypothetical protein